MPLLDEDIVDGELGHLEVHEQIAKKLNAKIDPCADFGAVGDGVTNDTARVLEAQEEVGSDGILFLPAGRTFLIDEELVFEGHVSGIGATILWAGGSGNAVTLRTGSGIERYENKSAYLPEVVQQTKRWDGTDVGVRVVNAYQSNIRVPRVTNFSEGLLATSFGVTGTVYSDFFLGFLQNNKVNLKLAPGDDDAWVNENNFYNGRMHINSEEGSNISGCRHIVLASSAHPVNNNVFYKPSIEGNGPEFHVECWGQTNLFIAARWEAAPPKLALRARSASLYAHSNLFIEGYNAESIVFTEDADTRYNKVLDRDTWRLNGASADGVLALSNFSSSNNPVLTALAAGSFLGTAASTAYRMALGANFYKGKQTADTQPRIQIDNQNGILGAGSGSAAIDTELSRAAANVWGLGANDCLVTGKAVTGSRPTVTTVGAQFFDTTLNQPIWWDGAVWKDAMGNTV